MKLRTSKGFTLIELLIVILILGILMALLLPTLLSAQRRGREATARQLLTGIITGIEQYQADKGAYPLDDVGAGVSTNYTTKNVAEALKSYGAGKIPYFHFKDDQLGEHGIRNPVAEGDTTPEKGFYYYTEWWSKQDKTNAKNPYKFDLWCLSVRGLSETDPGYSDAIKGKSGATINNWE
jgi:type II secretion system protein G